MSVSGVAVDVTRVVPPEIDPHAVFRIGAPVGLHHDDEGDGLVGQERRLFAGEGRHREDDEPSGVARVDVRLVGSRRALEFPVRVELLEEARVADVADTAEDPQTVLVDVVLAVVPVGLGDVGRRELDLEGLVEARVPVGRQGECRDSVPADRPRVFAERADLHVDVRRVVLLAGVVVDALAGVGLLGDFGGEVVVRAGEEGEDEEEHAELRLMNRGRPSDVLGPWLEQALAASAGVDGRVLVVAVVTTAGVTFGNVAVDGATESTIAELGTVSVGIVIVVVDHPRVFRLLGLDEAVAVVVLEVAPFRRAGVGLDVRVVAVVVGGDVLGGRGTGNDVVGAAVAVAIGVVEPGLRIERVAFIHVAVAVVVDPVAELVAGRDALGRAGCGSAVDGGFGIVLIGVLGTTFNGRGFSFADVVAGAVVCGDGVVRTGGEEQEGEEHGGNLESCGQKAGVLSYSDR